MKIIQLERLTAAISAALVTGALATGAAAQQRDNPPPTNPPVQRPAAPPGSAAPSAQRNPDGSVEIARADTGALRSYRDYMQGHDARVSKLVGADVNGPGDDDVGEIEEILLPLSGSAQPTLVLSVGGALGVGEKLIALPFDQLKVATKDDQFFIDRTAKQLESEPEFKYGATETANAQRPQAGAGAATGNRVAGLIGANVTDTSGETVGEVDEIVIATNAGGRHLAILSLGGVAGVGEKLVAVPLGDLQIERTATQAEGSPKAPKVHIAKSADALKQMSAYAYDEPGPAPGDGGLLR